MGGVILRVPVRGEGVLVVPSVFCLLLHPPLKIYIVIFIVNIPLTTFLAEASECGSMIIWSVMTQAAISVIFKAVEAFFIVFKAMKSEDLMVPSFVELSEIKPREAACFYRSDFC